MTHIIKPKKYRNVVRAVFDRPWAILPEKFDAIQELVAMRSDGVELSAEDIEAATGGRRPGGRDYGRGAVAVMPLFGVLAQRMGMLEAMSGGTSTETFGKAFREAVADPEVSHIVLHIDSPGGDVFGTQELSQMIYDARGTKPITAVVDSMAASAAYWIASAADRVVVTPGGVVGSIGVLMAHTDTTEMEASLGIKTTIMRVPEAKAEGAGGESLTDDAKAHKMAMIAEYYGQFADTVARNRGVTRAVVDARYGQGRVVTAREALSAGMVDEIAAYDMAVSSILRGTATNMSAKETETQQVAAPVAPVAAEPVKVTTAATPQPSQPKATAEQILAAVKIATGIPTDRRLALVEELVSAGGTYDDAIARIGAEAARESVEPGITRIESGASELDKFHAAATSALVTRGLGGKVPAKVYNRQTNDYVAYAPSRDNRFMGAVELGRECLLRHGYARADVDGLSRQQIARVMMGAPPYTFGLRAASDGAAYNVSGMFSNVLLDAANVIARNSYDDVYVTFDQWMRRAESLPDFKQVHKIVSGEVGDPRAIPEDGSFEETTISDSKESYRLTVWGNKFSCSWQMIVNDSLGEFMKIPAKMGAAMRRKQNRLAYNVLKDNAAMADTGLLFNTTAQTTAGGHANLTEASATPTVATLTAMSVKMAQMLPLNTTDGGALNLKPKYLITCPALGGTVAELLASTANPAVGGSAAGNSGVANIWRGMLEPIVDAELSTAFGGLDSTWYLATDANEMEHIEYAYLQGLETPALEREESFDQLAMKYRIYQAFAVHPVEYRGLQKHKGTT